MPDSKTTPSTGLVLGVSAFYHDSAAAIVRNGDIVAAAQEERFSRRKHDPRMPASAINYCLEEAFVNSGDLDAVVFYDNPLLTFDRVVKNAMTVGSMATDQFQRATRSVLGHKVWVDAYLREELGTLGRSDTLLVVDHHRAHAAAAYYPSPFDDAAILTLDGVGEWATTTVGHGRGKSLEIREAINYPHSLGLLYSAFTYYCGFKVNSGEYKLMGLAPYGEPRYYDSIRENLIDIRPDGSYRLNTGFLGYLDGDRMTNSRFDGLFGGPPRKPESMITRKEMDLAASVQKVTEDVVLALARHAKQVTGSANLCLAGGVALNCVANGKVLRAGIFDSLWIQPAAGDAGGALGAALAVSYLRLDSPRVVSSAGRDSQKGSYLGPSYSSAEVRAFLDRYGYPYEQVEDGGERARRIASYLSEGRIVGYMCGRMEFGPRALGARSILGDPRQARTQSVMNLKIKYRESFRPFAPAVLSERACEYFDLAGESPYMLLVAPVRQERRKPFDLAALRSESDDMLQIINKERSDIPAVTHVDYSARVQTVNRDDKPDFHAVIKAFEELTGCAVVVNTSFNVRGEPIVCSPDDAYRCFMRTEMDVLVMEDLVLEKSMQPPFKEEGDWRSKYELD
jgi:carbamoyltransferase